MIINKTHYGIEVIIPETDWNSEFVYTIRQVRTLNKGFRLHPSINELECEEKKLTRKLLLRIYSMENAFNEFMKNRKYVEWDNHNKMDFNEFYHDGINELIEMIDSISYKYYNNCTEGYPFHKYSCCL